MIDALDVLELTPADLAEPLPPWEIGVAEGGVLVAVLDGCAREWDELASRAGSVGFELLGAPVVTIGVVRDAPADAGAGLLRGCDLIVDEENANEKIDERVQELIAALTRVGAPALVAAQLLRAPTGALATESFAYSMLLWGEDFAAWREDTPRHASADLGASRLTVTRNNQAWVLTLTRPARHNAFDAQMREELCDALDAIASAPPAPIVIRGDGPSFCSGGDLDEFGTASSPVKAHLVRTERSVARRLARLGPRLVAGVHGRCIGAGVELAAFAASVIAAETATFCLPELTLGLNLGAGGTLSIPARIGRHRTLELLLSGRPIDALAALDWGLVDELVADERLAARCLAAAEELA